MPRRAKSAHVAAVTAHFCRIVVVCNQCPSNINHPWSFQDSRSRNRCSTTTPEPWRMLDSKWTQAMRRTLIPAGLVWLLSFGLWCTHAAGQKLPAAQSAVPELMKREVSREGIEYLIKLRKNTPFGTKDFNLAALRAGMGSRRAPTIKGVKLIKVKVGDTPCEWVVAAGADPDIRLLYLHGGGFVSGSGGYYLAQAAHTSAAAKCAVLLPDYR